MKKEGLTKRKNIYAITIFILAGLISLNLFPNSIVLHILGISFIIAGVYGLVSLNKTGAFMFKN